MKYFTPTKLSENISETPEGYLVCIGVPIARTGEMVYSQGETPLASDTSGKTIIERDESEVFKPETMASFEGKSITIGHPVNWVDPENWKELSKGTIQNVRRGEGDHKNDLLADLMITDSVAISLVKAGLREVSCGYEAEYIPKGDGRGVQTNIIGNHLALVHQGRAGEDYAIKDHKTKGVWKMKWKENIKAIFAKAQDEAMKVADEEGKEPPKKEGEGKDSPNSSYDELVKVCNSMNEMLEKMKPKDASSPAAGASGEVEKKTGDAEERFKKLEESMDAMMKRMDAYDKMEENPNDEELIEDDDFDESLMVGDSASRVEILAPGLKLSKTFKADALKEAWKTGDGQKVIKSLNGDKEPDYKSAEKVDTLFIAASELLKTVRSREMTSTRTVDGYESALDRKVPMSAEKLNEMNAKFWVNRK